MRKFSGFGWSLALLVCVLPAMSSGHEHSHDDSAPAAFQSESLFNLPDAWTKRDGKVFRLEDLRGSPAVIAMIYTSCPDVCPLIVEDMKSIERQLPPSLAGKVNFAVFSFDPDRDTVTRLQEYAESHGITGPTWTVARGPNEAVQRLAIALGLKYKKTASGDFEHGTTIYILDKAGVVRHIKSGIGGDKGEVLSTLKQLGR